MFKNKIYRLNNNDVMPALKSIDRDVFVVEIDGKHMQSWFDFCSDIEEKMKFPTSCADHNYDGYVDWMCDLQWLGKKEYLIVIYNFSKLLEHDIKTKELIIKMFKEQILPWWQEEAELYSTFAKFTPFNVYLVD